ncbi:MAG: transcriptional repressor [Deltaproteobacteria bacterium]|jgi:Fur family peroxide stress response transcriptional regulator|nr:transcriptional repressor [Deltaproteobacteria bacterium]MBW2480572.1 transcriptional repressor [Deltaproteobacteria bacterium]
MQGQAKHPRLERFAEICKASHLKVTPQRMAIYRELLISTEHPTVDAMFQIVKKEFPNISYDTVSRTMLTFAQIGIADIAEVYGGAKRFDPDVADHHHLHCVSCGNIIDFHNDQYNNLDIPDEVRQNFRVLSSRVVFKGICEKCATTP